MSESVLESVVQKLECRRLLVHVVKMDVRTYDDRYQQFAPDLNAVIFEAVSDGFLGQIDLDRIETEQAKGSLDHYYDPILGDHDFDNVFEDYKCEERISTDGHRVVFVWYHKLLVGLYWADDDWYEEMHPDRDHMRRILVNLKTGVDENTAITNPDGE